MSTRPYVRGLGRLALSGALWVAGWIASDSLSASTTVLGDRGEVYSLVQTTLGVVVSGTPADQAGQSVLALEKRVGSEVSSVLVPSTGDAAVETFANLVYERSSRSVYAVWQGYIGIHPVIYLAGYSEGGWSSPILVTADAFSSKFAPRLVVSRDVAGAGDGRIERTILHVIYAQEDAAGEVSTLYAPVILHNGVYAGPHAIYRLNDLVDDAVPPSYVISPVLLRRPSLRAGVDGQSVVASFVDEVSGRLVSVEMAFLPLQISRVGGEARGQVIIVGANGMGPRGSAARTAFSSQVRAAVRSKAIAEGFNDGTADALADAVYGVTQAEAGSDEAALGRVAAEARGQVIIVGVRGRNHGLESSQLADAYVISNTGDGVGDEDIHFVLASRVVAPRTGAEHENEIFTSANGQRTLVSWTDDQRFVRYREAGPEPEAAWSEILELKLSADFTPERARQILESKVN